MNLVLECLKKYVVWKGRAQRAEYWVFFLYLLIGSILLSVIDVATGTFDQASGQGLLSGLFSLAMFLPSLSAFVRRLHDTGRSGWWFWLLLVPLVGPIVLLVFLCQDSEAGRNDYGPSPKQAGRVTARAAVA